MLCQIDANHRAGGHPIGAQLYTVPLALIPPSAEEA
jgi:hypothetical protein